jgi:hypothetical protein
VVDSCDFFNCTTILSSTGNGVIGVTECALIRISLTRPSQVCACEFDSYLSDSASLQVMPGNPGAATSITITTSRFSGNSLVGAAQANGGAAVFAGNFPTNSGNVNLNISSCIFRSNSVVGTGATSLAGGAVFVWMQGTALGVATVSISDTLFAFNSVTETPNGFAEGV